LSPSYKITSWHKKGTIKLKDKERCAKKSRNSYT